jgi:hypothetical protein
VAGIYIKKAVQKNESVINKEENGPAPETRLEVEITEL